LGSHDLTTEEMFCDNRGLSSLSGSFTSTSLSSHPPNDDLFISSVDHVEGFGTEIMLTDGMQRKPGVRS
jgi:hypothetical protein